MSLRTLSKFEIILSISLVITVAIIGGYYLEIPFLSNLSKEFQQWAVILSTIAWILGLVNLTFYHVKKVQKRGQQWYMSLYLLILTYFWLGVALILGVNSAAYQWFMVYNYQPARTAIYAISALYIVASAYRAFRFKTSETSLMLICGILVMMRNVPLGSVYVPWLLPLANWLMNIPVMAAQRALTISVGVGSAMFAFRVLIGKERRIYGISEEEVTLE